MKYLGCGFEAGFRSQFPAGAPGVREFSPCLGSETLPAHLSGPSREEPGAASGEDTRSRPHSIAPPQALQGPTLGAQGDACLSAQHGPLSSLLSP